MQRKTKVKAKEDRAPKEKAKEKENPVKAKAEENPKAQVKMKMNNERSKIVVIGSTRALALEAHDAATIMILTKGELVWESPTIPIDQDLLVYESPVRNLDLVVNRHQEKTIDLLVIYGLKEDANKDTNATIIM